MISISSPLFVLDFCSDTGALLLVDFDKKDFQPEFAERYTDQDYKVLKILGPYFTGCGALIIMLNYSVDFHFITSVAIWFLLSSSKNYFKLQLSPHV